MVCIFVCLVVRTNVGRHPISDDFLVNDKLGPQKYTPPPGWGLECSSRRAGKTTPRNHRSLKIFGSYRLYNGFAHFLMQARCKQNGQAHLNTSPTCFAGPLDRKTGFRDPGPLIFCALAPYCCFVFPVLGPQTRLGALDTASPELGSPGGQKVLRIGFAWWAKP